MKRNQKLTLTLITLAALTLGSSSAWARHHWNNGNGMGPQGYSQLTTEQQATAQKLHNDFMSKPVRYVSNSPQNVMNTMRY